ncbi:MAG: hypothetical protein WCN88_02110 [Candidatus Falkowbacteria bacterium]
MENMLKEALSKVEGPLGQLWKNLSGDDGEVWLKELNKFLRKEVCWKERLNAGKNDAHRKDSRDSKYLKYSGKLSFRIKGGIFSGRDRFAISKRRDVPIRIHFISKNFEFWCLSHTSFMVEVDESAWHDLDYFRVLMDTKTENIIDSLGGEKIAQTTMLEIYHTLLLQGRGQKGKLLINGDFNVFFTPAFNGNNVVMYLAWNGKAWGINSRALVEGTIGVNCRVFVKGLQINRKTKT